MQHVSVLVNPAAGGNKGLSRTKSLVAELADRGWTVDLLKASTAPAVAESINDARRRGMSRLLLAGGDGLVHHALPALVDTDTVVGIVPVGTGNDFVRGLGLPSKPAQALDAATGPLTAAVDVIEVGDGGGRRCHVATVLTAGFSGRVNRRANELSSRPGFPRGSGRYMLATMVELATLEPTRFTVEVDGGQSADMEALLVAVGNTRFFGGGMAVCPDARFDDGAMDLVVIKPVSRTTFARVLPFVFGGRHVRHRAVESIRCRTLRISTIEPLWADGEPLHRNGLACHDPNRPPYDHVADRGAPGDGSEHGDRSLCGATGNGAVELTVRSGALLVAGVAIDR